ncbi:phage antirepressor N-terminal domain-containing protein [Chitinibacter sp. FCG-7]|uniref:Phage antirepressor N-terminal domain-containing protein n=1 Tax=Chitinibacter mangrovi TaxID=3153927 RepID=A0AAU7F7P1_9NEIS
MNKAASLNQQQDGFGAPARAGADVKSPVKPKQSPRKTAITQNHLIPFALGNIEAFSCEDDFWVSVRHLCAVFGIAFASQHRKLSSNPRWRCHLMIARDSQGRSQEMLTLPLNQIPAFLNSIEPNRVKPEVRQSLLAYQDECTTALFSYWTTGRAEQQSAAAQMQLQVADTLAVFKEEYCAIYGKPAGAVPHPGMYAKIQATLNRAVFGVDKLPDLPRKSLPKLALERLCAAARMLRRAFIRGQRLADACKQVSDAFPAPVLNVEITVGLAK